MGAILRRAQRLRGFDRDADDAPTVHSVRSGSPSRASTSYVDRLPPDRGGGFGVDPRELVDLGIVRAPDEIARADAAGIDRADWRSAVRSPSHFENAAAFFGFLRTAPVGRIEDDAVAGLERRDAVRVGGLDDDAAIGDPHHAAHQHAAMARGAAFDHGLMIGAGEEEIAEAARVDLLELQFGGGRDGERAAGPRLVDCLAIGRAWSARRSRRPCSGLRS